MQSPLSHSGVILHVLVCRHVEHLLVRMRRRSLDTHVHVRLSHRRETRSVVAHLCIRHILGSLATGFPLQLARTLLNLDVPTFRQIHQFGNLPEVHVVMLQ